MTVVGSCLRTSLPVQVALLVSGTKHLREEGFMLAQCFMEKTGGGPAFVSSGGNLHLPARTHIPKLPQSSKSTTTIAEPTVQTQEPVGAFHIQAIAVLFGEILCTFYLSFAL